MRKFKHIRSNRLATLSTHGNDYNITFNGEIEGYFPKWVIENSNDWKEIKEEFPKIISFRNTSSKNINALTNKSTYHGWSLDSMLHRGECVDSGHFEIYEVAVSETKTFKLGDEVTISKLQRPMPFVITKFYFDCNNEHILCNGECCGNGNVNVMKVEHYTKPEPLLATIDGFEIFEEDYIYWVRSDYTLGESKYYHKVHIKDSYNNLKYFKNKEAAQKYIEENKPIYSKQQIKEAVESSFIKENYILDVPYCCANRFKEEIFKQKLGL